MLLDRERELAAIDALLAGRGGALVVEGAGKSALLKSIRADGFRRLSACGTASESTIAFAGLHQLLGPLAPEVESLAPVHRDAIHTALGSLDSPCTDLVLYTAVLRLFESVSPLLVTVDDVDLWDQSSIAALLFAARRVSSVAFVLTATGGWNPGLPSLVLPGLPYQAILTEPEVLPNASLAARLEAHSADAARRGGIASAATVLRAAARLSNEPERQRRSAAAAYLAWKSGQSALARTLVAEATPERHDPAVARTLDRLHGLIALGDGDQLSAHDHLLRAGPDPGLLFMAAAAAHHAGLPLEPIAARFTDPGFGEYAGLLARLTSLSADAHTADPWRLRAAAPASLRTSDAHQWLWPLVLSMSGPSARQAYDFGRSALDEFAVNGMHAVLTLPMLWLSELEFDLGHWDRAQARAEEGIRSTEDTGQRVRRADFHATLALLAAARGSAVACLRETTAARDLAVPLHNHLAASRATWAAGLFELSNGNSDAAAEHLSSITHHQVARLATADLIEALVRAGDWAGARRTLEAWRPWADHTTSPLVHARLARSRALLSDEDDTGKLFGDAESFGGDHPFEQARTQLLHGEWLRRTRRPSKARPLLRSALETFTRLGASTWAAAAEAQLRPTGGGRPRTGAALTDQELRVARLAAHGLSNREIGTRLFLSPRTVGYHLYKTYPKLGISTRSQLRALDLDRG
ncbi:helix-turn-helix transcriptional regulator [Amycolatopsis magusensis]|uniref:helix-turn-helix transcriptional regulator n=1 Tax=Amycolatopsis magusensis TaxID=882444 RepID=UPI003C2B24DC